MKRESLLWLPLLCLCQLLSGCATKPPPGGVAPHAPSPEPSAPGRVNALSPEAKSRILSLNPDRVSDQEVRDLLSGNPAPRIISIHGGVLPIKTAMNSFASFLIAMGYPETAIRNPGNGSYTYGYYEDSRVIAGTIAWHYERDGLSPVLVGHSQGGIQVVRVLHLLAGDPAAEVPVWNPVARKAEERCQIRDPLTGTNRPVVGLRIGYATAAVAGGLARALPNEWDMNSRLRQIPDSVEDFTGFQKGFDILGGDLLGYGSANDYHAMGDARVRNVRLPAGSAHGTIPYAGKLLKDPAIKEWISSYEPGAGPAPLDCNAQMLWAAEVWHGIKKHWVLQLQRLIQAQTAKEYDR